MSVRLSIENVPATPTPHPTLTGARDAALLRHQASTKTEYSVVMATHATQRRSTPGS